MKQIALSVRETLKKKSSKSTKIYKRQDDVQWRQRQPTGVRELSDNRHRSAERAATAADLSSVERQHRPIKKVDPTKIIRRLRRNMIMSAALVESTINKPSNQITIVATDQPQFDSSVFDW